MTSLTKPVHRETRKTVGNRAVIVSIAPCGSQSEARVGFRLKGKRTQYVALVSDLFRVAALWHGQKEKAAKSEARKQGIPWKRAPVIGFAKTGTKCVPINQGFNPRSLAIH